MTLHHNYYTNRISSIITPPEDVLLYELNNIDPVPDPAEFAPKYGLESYPNLSMLVSCDLIFIEQLADMNSKLPGVEQDNHYVIRDPRTGHRIIYASENTPFLCRCLFSENRPFEVSLYNYNGSRVFQIERKCSFGLCCVCGICCGNGAEIVHENGDIIGNISQRCCHIRKPIFDVYDAGGRLVFCVVGPPVRCSCSNCCNIIFTIYEPDRVKVVGKIFKKWGGMKKEILTDCDTFGINFPRSMQPVLKALLIACVFIIDFTYFESRG